ncbi:zf-HC2 domain-containing protein [Nocardioides marmoriginsengisoli]|uniref:Zf-HC2 domain-containing protein n=1 Tax=Nocardioides marmoriginsengisoli TaxID=661483 RepID=A0A3N0CS15_9ACTN|nr:zf-HC2 domain-containing protein [Nocardioides marmoriginsengisoli]RNL66190.1 zf-HC2 domain-containing protein [Nocardioides marmoriginsengisoli]
MILKLHGHIGSSASALVDGQLSAAEEERAWSHILGCPGCRRLVEREGWIKQRLAGLGAGPSQVAAPAGLLGTLYDVDAWAAVDEIERRSTRRRAAVAVAGASSVGIAVIALMTVTAPPVSRGEVPGQPSPAMIGNGVPRNAPGTGLSADIENAAFGGRSR